MTTEEQELAAELFHLVNRLVDQRVQIMIQPIQNELELTKKLVKSMLNEWVDTNETKRLTNIKRSETLKVKRTPPGNILIGKKVGGKYYYLRESIVALNESATDKERGRAGRYLPA